MNEETNNLSLPLSASWTMDEILSPEFVKPDDCEWFVMRATYNRAEKAVEVINAACSRADDVEGQHIKAFAFTPLETKRVFEGEQRKYVRVACMPNMLFVLASRQVAELFTHRSDSRWAMAYVDFAYDHTQKNEHGRDRIMRVPHRQMINFLRVMEVDNPQAFMLRDEQCTFRPGGYVRIINGLFEGAIGRVARIQQQTRVVVTIEGLLSYATSYIPKAFMQPLTDDEAAALGLTTTKPS